MDGYMQAAKKMLVLIDKFDKEDLTDDDKMRELDNKLREIYSNKKSLYADTILHNYVQIMEVMQATEEQTKLLFSEKFNINGFAYYEDEYYKIIDRLVELGEMDTFHMNLEIACWHSNETHTDFEWTIDYTTYLEDGVEDTDSLTDDSYLVNVIAKNQPISSNAAFREIDFILDVINHSPNLINVIKARFVKKEEYSDKVLNILAVRIFYLFHIIAVLIVYGATTEATKILEFPVVAIENKYIYETEG